MESCLQFRIDMDTKTYILPQMTITPSGLVTKLSVNNNNCNVKVILNNILKHCCEYYHPFSYTVDLKQKVLVLQI